MSTRRGIEPVAGKALLFGYALFILFPLLWAVNTAFKPMSDILKFPPVWIAESYTLDPFMVVATSPTVRAALLDSLVINTGQTAVTMVFATLAGYGFSRFREITRARRVVFLILALSFLPAVTIVLPMFFIWDWLNLLDTRLGIIIAYFSFNVPFATWLMRDYFDRIPLSYERAARVDGYSRFRTMRKVVVPLVMPGVFAVTVLAWIFGWTEFLFAFILGSENVTTYTALYPNFQADRAILYNRQMSLALIALVPPIVLIVGLRQRVVDLF